MVTILSQYKTINITENFEIKEYKGAIASLTTPCKIKYLKWFLVNLEVSATTNLPMKEKMPVFELFIDFNFSQSSGLKSCAVEKFSHFGFAWNLGRNWLLTSYFSYFLCRLKFIGFTSRKNLSPVNRSSLRRKSLSCSAKRTELQTFFFFLILDLWWTKPFVNTLDTALF